MVKARSKAKAKTQAKAKPKPKAKAPKKKAAAKAPATRTSRAKASAAKSPTRKPAAKSHTKTAARRRAATAGRAPAFHVPVGPARQRLRDALAWVEDFVEECKRLATVEGPLPWEHASSLELVGLERWGTQLAKSDHAAGVCALVLAAQLGLPRVLAAGGAALVGGNSREGASVASQLDRCARWVDDPSEPNREMVEDGFDPTREMHAWDPGRVPSADRAYLWYSEVGQLASAAVVKSEHGDAASTSYYYWPADVSVGRGLVVAVRGLRGPGTDVAAILRELYRALSA